MDKVTNDARIYTDVQGLEQLRGQIKTDPNSVKKEMAQQFESLLLQMVLRSMRDANNAFSSGLFSTNDMSMYQDMFDKQLSLALSSRGVGFANMLEANIDRQNPNQVADHQPASLALSYQSNEPKLQPLSKNTVIAMSTDDQQHRASPELSPHDSSEKLAEKSLFSSPKEFVTSLWDNAKHAASIIGVNPAVLMAQAALETDWGRKVIPHASGNSSHNLFNIKADPTWHQTSTTASTLEQKDGVLTKEKANFRCYQSFKESFQDYASMIKFSSRYKKAVENAHEPAAYTHALQEAGYASDKNYANKIIGIMKSPLFQSLISNLK